MSTTIVAGYDKYYDRQMIAVRKEKKRKEQ